MRLSLVLPVLFLMLGTASLSAALVGLMTRRILALDHPDHRKAHIVPTPKGGGLGVALAWLAAMLVLYRIGPPWPAPPSAFGGVVPGAVLLVIVSFLDDLFDWPFVAKLAAQAASVGLVIAGGLWVRTVHLPGNGALDLGHWGVALTAAWMLFAINAMNFIDGLNGLASGIGLLAGLGLAGFALLNHDPFVMLTAMLLSAALLGFLPFNFPQARIFLGDVGSQFIGFLLAVLGIAAGRFPEAKLSFLLVPMLLSGVLFDVGFTLMRRAMSGENLSRPHRGHLYQVAHRSAVSSVAITVAHWACTCVGGGFAFIWMSSGPKLWIVSSLVILQLTWLGFVAVRARRAGIRQWSHVNH